MDYAYTDLHCTTDDDVLIIELNRPSKRNAMRLELRTELIDALKTAEADDDVSAVVVTGAGDRAFSAGADLNELQGRTVDSEMARAALLRRQLPEVAESLSKPLVAAINSACIGAGLEFALACPLRLSAPGATFGLPEVKLGLIPGSGGTQRLTRAVGVTWAMRLTLVGDTIDAQTAERIGLVTGVCDEADLLPEAIGVARTVGAHPGIAFVAARDAVNRALDVDLGTGIDYERKLFALCLSTDAPRREATALLERLEARRADSSPTPSNA